MGGKKYILQIEKPCNQNWDEMVTCNTGKFCQHCQHSIIDFSNLSDSEVIQLLAQQQGEVCGRVEKSQLDRLMVEAGKPNSNPMLYRALAGMLLLAGTGTVVAGDNTPRLNTVSAIDIHNKPTLPVKDTTVAQQEPVSNNTIQLKIVSAGSKIPICNWSVRVTINGVTTEAMTNNVGEFILNIPETAIANVMPVTVEGPGSYLSTSFTITKDQLPITGRVVEMTRLMVMGKMMYTPPKNK